MEKVYDIKNFKITKEAISYKILGESIVVPLKDAGSAVLLKTDPKNLQTYELDQNRIGIHWPLLDEDLSIEGLLRSAGLEDLIVPHKVPSWYCE